MPRARAHARTHTTRQGDGEEEAADPHRELPPAHLRAAHAHARTSTRACAHAHAHARTHARMHAHARKRTRAHTHARTHACMHARTRINDTENGRRPTCERRTPAFASAPARLSALRLQTRRRTRLSALRLQTRRPTRLSALRLQTRRPTRLSALRLQTRRPTPPRCTSGRPHPTPPSQTGPPTPPSQTGPPTLLSQTGPVPTLCVCARVDGFRLFRCCTLFQTLDPRVSPRLHVSRPPPFLGVGPLTRA